MTYKGWYAIKHNQPTRCSIVSVNQTKLNEARPFTSVKENLSFNMYLKL